VRGDRDAAGEHNDKTRRDLARSHDPFADRKRTHIPEPAHALDVQWIELGKYLIAALLEKGW
jgi:hypothetical protein